MRQKLTHTAACCLLLLGCFLSHLTASAQARRITGNVISGGIGISGVSILVKGTTNATSTDADGKFALTIDGDGAVLVFSSVGYATQEIPVENRTAINVTMEESDRVLSEVVVTALGIRREYKKVGYAMQEVKGAELIKARDPNVFSQLEGKVAGLDIGSSPEMYGRPNIVLRGNKDLLIVVDGVPVSSDTWNVNADDIESVNVLKGPNAAALYGFRGLNGAIIITTKRSSKTTKGWQVDFNSTTMFQRGFTVIPKVQTQFGRGSSYQYAYNAKGVFTPYPPGQTLYDFGQRLAIWGPRMDGQPVVQFDSPYDPATGTWSPSPYLSKGGKNLQNFLGVGLLSTNNVSMSAGGNNYDIRLSYSHMYQKGQVPNTAINMDNLNLTAGYSITPRLKIDASLNLNIQYSPNVPDADYGPNSYVYMFNVYGSPDFDVRELRNYWKGPQGVPGLMQYNENYGRSNNPYFMAYEWLRAKYKTDIYGFARVSYAVNKDLNVSLRTQVTTWNQTTSEKVPPSTILNQYLSWYYPAWYGDYRQDDRDLLENNTDLLLSYNKGFSNFHINANLGGSWRSYKYNSTWETTRQLAVPGLYSFTNSINSPLAYNFGSNMMVYSGYYAIDLAYKNYVNLSTTGRVDNLSTLPAANSTFFYPSISLSTSLGDYIKLPSSIDLLKFRASFADVKGGLTSAQAGSAYNMLTGNTLNGGLLGYGFEQYTAYDGPSYANQSAYQVTTYYNGQPSVSYSTNIADPTLKPFDIKSYEAGLDYLMFKGRLGLNLTFYHNLNGPLIYPLPVASSTGYQSHNVNAVVSAKNGWEVVFNATPVKSRDFRWDILVNWSTYKETLHSVTGGQNSVQLGNHIFKVGERLDAFYSTAYVTDGHGNIVYNSSGGPLQAPSDIGNLKRLGYLDPDYSYGINNRFTYKNVSLSFQFDGRVGGVIYDDLWYHAMNGGTAAESDEGAFHTARNAEWETTGMGTVAPTPQYVGKGVVITSGTPNFSGGNITNLDALKFGANTTAVTVQSYLSSYLGSNFDQAYTISRTFAKLREVRLTYNFTEHTLGKSVFRSAAVALVGRNLLYFAARKDFDIDQYASGFNIGTQSTTGTSADVTLSSSTSRWFGININLGF